MNHPRVLVTGSSRGIGLAIALRLAKSGWQVALHGSKLSDDLQRTAEALGEHCAGVFAIPLADADDAEALWHAATSQGPLDALVNNAGIYRQHDFAATPEEEFNELAAAIMGTNFLAPMHLTRLASQHFLSQEHGRVVQVASRVGLKGEPGAALYAASKAALISLVKSLAVEHAAKGVRHFAIAPGWVDTAMAREGMEERLPSIIATIPYGRMGTPEDCAHAVNWLLSGEADYMTGLIIDINGASYMR